jgi:hypothetical protein
MAIMLDGKFRTLFELDEELRERSHIYLTTSISARLRELRAPDFGGWIVERRQRKGATDRVQEYRLLAPRPKAMPGTQQDLFA